MKLPKINSLNFDKNVMKLRYLIPFYLMLGLVTFCTRKGSEEKQELVTDEKANVEAVAASISGKLQLDTVSNRIYADITVYVSNNDFRYAEDFMAMQTTGNYKGIAFRYYDPVNNEPDNGNPTIPMRVAFDFDNKDNWRINDSVRVMSFNEEEHAVFTGLKTYFLERMSAFQNNPITYSQLVSFNQAWNANNRDNIVEPSTEEDTDSISSGNNNRAVKSMAFLPRLSKDDGILSLTLKR